MQLLTFPIYRMLLISLLLCVSGVGNELVAQTNENLVPNPSFERFSRVPIGWFYKGKNFTDVMKYWNAPTGASPDIFGPKVIVPKHHFEFWVSSLPKSLHINRLGAYFSTEEIQLIDDSAITVQPQIEAKKILTTRNGRWTRVATTFTATEEASYLIIGNFYPDKETKVLKSRSDALSYAYYYLDDVLLRKEQPILEVPIKPDDLSKTPIEVGRVVTLKNIFFETDKYELLPRSFVELNKLLALMRTHPNMVIEIRGHTDIVGNSDYNQYLSRKRSKSVVHFLIEHGIEAYRLQYKGFGSEQPTATNDTKEGRQLNRRVEFKIISNTGGMN